MAGVYFIVKRGHPKKINKKKNLSVISKLTPKKETVIVSEMKRNLLLSEDDIPEDDRPENAFKIIGSLKTVGQHSKESNSARKQGGLGGQISREKTKMQKMLENSAKKLKLKKINSFFNKSSRGQPNISNSPENQTVTRSTMGEGVSWAVTNCTVHRTSNCDDQLEGGTQS